MRARIAACALAAVLGACAAPSRPQAAPGASRVGAPSPPFDPSVLERAPSGWASADGRTPVRMPDRITLPATYRLVLVDGHLALVRETDAQAIDGEPGSMRVVMGEVGRGELAFQPALLPQELAAELAASRESSARMDNALESVMQRSRELSEQARALEAQGRKLADLLSAAQARVRELEGAGPQAQRPAAPAKAPAD